MKELLVISDLEQIKAISHPYRLEILETFNNKPATAKDISQRLGEPHAKVNYHIKILNKIGLLELVDEVVKLGIVEKYYCPVAKTFVVDSGFMKSTNDESINDVALALYEKVSKDFYKSLELDPKETPRKKMIYENEIFLKPEEADQFHQEVRDLIDKYSKTEKNGHHKYFIANLVMPLED